MVDCYALNPYTVGIFLSLVFMGFAYFGMRIERKFPEKKKEMQK